jgi:ion channel POLLUX/CASTOR
MTTISLQERFRYWFDNVMSRGPIALMGLLGLASLVFIAIVALVVQLFQLFPPLEDGAKPPGFFEVLWGNLMRTLDSGTMGGDEGWGFRAAMLVVTIGGVIIVASLIGIISSAFDSKVDELRKGRSKVLENDHTLILGWNPQVFPIISEICEANQSRRSAAIVVLADRDKVEMEDELRTKIGNAGKTRIICRSGDPMDLTDLEISNPHTARSIIVLAPTDSDDPDSVVIKTTLALTNNPRRKTGPYHIVAEIENPSNLEAARLVGRDEAHWVLAGELISRITVQTCRQNGLSVVYTELLDFGGDEIYFSEQPTLTGKTYFESQLAFSDSCVMGVVKSGAVHLNPDANLILAAGDQLIVIAEDDSTIRLSAPGGFDANAIAESRAFENTPERTLVLGWNHQLDTMLHELGEYVAAGSSLTVVADVDPPELPSLDKLNVTFQRGDTTARSVLENLKPHSYDHIIVLAYKESLAPQQADAKTLITLLHLREMADREGKDLNVVSEMLDNRNRELAEVTRADDFIVSDKLISLMLSQINPGQPANFYTVLEAARRRGETAIGYRVNAEARDSGKGYGVRVNPKKGEAVRFAPEDKIIVLAEN